MKELELLFEIGAEEIPAGMIGPALDFLGKDMARRLDELGLAHGHVRTAGTPRRLCVVVEGLAERQPDRREEVLGPARAVGFKDGEPTPAALGFARSQGVEVDDLLVRETPKGEYLAAVREITGAETRSLLPDLLRSLVRAVPFAKSMRWADGEISFARPIQWLLALYGGEPVDLELDGLVSGATSRGHRFMAPEPFAPHDYASLEQELEQRFVIIDPARRRALVEEEVRRAAAEHGGGGVTAELDPALVDLVCNLVELPCGVCGGFDEKFLQLPEEVLITSMREHQKYFPVRGADGGLAPRFVAVNNTRIQDARAAAAGHERVLRARLEDALFFFNEDRKHGLDERAGALSGIVFQAKLGTMADKTARIRGLTAHLAGELGLDSRDRDHALRAAELAKADLLTEMVGEFPTLQGVMGREYALLEGEDPAVAQAIFEHYLPRRAGDALPGALPGALVGLADRLDSIAGCFAIGLRPTGNTDPFGLRRLALGLLHVIQGLELRLSLERSIAQALEQYQDLERKEGLAAAILDFIRLRFENDLVAQGLPQGAVAAGVAAGFDDVCDCLERIRALAGMAARDDFALLSGFFKRIANITRDNTDTAVDPALFQEQAEQDLFQVAGQVAGQSAALFGQGDYAAGLEALLPLKEPVDRFFDQVMVMAEDPALRANRLNLLTSLRETVLLVGDISLMARGERG